jgi:hypothetical protein
LFRSFSRHNPDRFGSHAAVIGKLFMAGFASLGISSFIDIWMVQDQPKLGQKREVFLAKARSGRGGQ